MKSYRLTAVFWFLGVWSCLAVWGCTGPSPDNSSRPEAATAYLLSEEPADAKGVVQCRALLEESGEPAEMTLIGRIGGLGQPTWDPDRAAFMMADLSLTKTEDHGDVAPGHDTDNCPFCRAKTKKELAGLAMIEVVDGDGNNPMIDARELLGISEGQIIVVRGKAELDRLGTVRIRTGSLFVRPSEG